MARELDCTATEQNGSNFLETFQLVESLEDRPPVPNHLLDTKLFRKTGQESKTVSVSPADIHFPITSLGKKRSRHFNLMNITKRFIGIQILPPQTKYFKIHYEKSGHLCPGTQMSCEVEFAPTEWRYYYDCVRIHCPEEENVVVPFHAYPVMKNYSLPENYAFPPTSIGDIHEKSFTLSSGVPVDFEFKIVYLQSNPAFTVSPMEGIIPRNEEVSFTVTFAPIRFETSVIKLLLNISQFNFKTQCCTLYGSSVPGLEMEKLWKTFSEKDPAVLDPHSVAPLDRLRIKKNKSEKSEEKPLQEIEYNGYWFPVQMNTVHAVSKVLNQKPNKLCTKDLKNILWKGKQNDSESRQVKAVTFENSIQQLIKEERQNQLRWQKKVGEDNMSAESKVIEQEYWRHIWENYKGRFSHDPRNYSLETKCIYRRTMRFHNETPEDVVDFNPYKNNLWPRRLYVKEKFTQAVHKVIIKNRYSKSLKTLKGFAEKLGPQKFTPDSIDEYLLRKKFHEEITKNYQTNFKNMSSKICSQSFMHTNHPGEKLRLDDTFSQVPLSHTEFISRKTVSYEELLVPQYYQLQFYEPCNIHDAAASYLYPDPERYMQTTPIVSDIVIDTHFQYRKKPNQHKGQPPETTEKPVPAKKIIQQPKKDSSAVGKPLMKLKMPDFMMHYLKNSTEHIFNPIPNLLTYENLLPYSEFDADYYMCPLSRFPKTNSSTQKKFLDRNDVMQGIMTWKKMPSPTLSAIISNPTVKDFKLSKDSEYLSTKLPPLLESMPEEWKELSVTDAKKMLQTRCNVNIIPASIEENFVLVSEDQYTEGRSYIGSDVMKRVQTEKGYLKKKMRERISSMVDLISDDRLLSS